jgi:spore coat protein U-like protein
MRPGAVARVVLGAALIVAGGAARLEAACTISSTGVSFGVYDVFSAAPTDSTGAVIYDCDPPDRNIRITLSTGSNGTFVPRALTNGSDELAYNLFDDAALTSIWGDGTGGSNFYFIKNPHPQKPVALTIYGRIPPLQDVATGSYTDSIIVSVDF